MRILLSNDDGYFAPGLAILAETLSCIAEITVVAPERGIGGDYYFRDAMKMIIREQVVFWGTN